MSKASYLVIVLVLLVNICTSQNIKKEPILGDLGAVEGNVIDIKGKKVSEASVSIYKGTEIVKEVKSDDDGYFMIDNLNPDTYALEVYNDDYEYYVNYNVEITKGKMNTLPKIKLSVPIQDVELKPVIYLYPEFKCKINVNLDYKGKLTHTYPKYENGWTVTAAPDGTLWDENRQEYYALFWEGNPNKPIIPKDGFVISGNQTIAFLEEKLSELGLNRREANEFIMFWMPQMENNPYNLIHFASTDYEDHAHLIVTPTPETIIRIMMVTKPLQQRIDFPLQDITPLKKVRKGFTLVEWGGTVMNENINL